MQEHIKQSTLSSSTDVSPTPLNPPIYSLGVGILTLLELIEVFQDSQQLLDNIVFDTRHYLVECFAVSRLLVSNF